MAVTKHATEGRSVDKQTLAAMTHDLGRMLETHYPQERDNAPTRHGILLINAISTIVKEKRKLLGENRFNEVPTFKLIVSTLGSMNDMAFGKDNKSRTERYAALNAKTFLTADTLLRDERLASAAAESFISVRAAVARYTGGDKSADETAKSYQAEFERMLEFAEKVKKQHGCEGVDLSTAEW
jgi:hypothetical protein